MNNDTDEIFDYEKTLSFFFAALSLWGLGLLIKTDITTEFFFASMILSLATIALLRLMVEAACEQKISKFKKQLAQFKKSKK